MQNKVDNKNLFEETENQESLAQTAKELKQKKITAVLFAIVALLLIILLIFIFVCSPAIISGESMQPTLQEGQVIVVSKLHKNPNVGDIVVYNKPTEKKKVIKRVVGVAGDTFYISLSQFDQSHLARASDNAIYPLSAEQKAFMAYTYRNNKVPEGGNYAGLLYFTIAEDEIFTIGDNRSNSIDGRNYGPIKLSSLIGIML